MKTSTSFNKLSGKNFYVLIESLAFLFLCYWKHRMDTNRNNNKDNDQQIAQVGKGQQDKHRSSAFRESSRGDEKSTTNVEEEANSEQERKEAMTERD